MGEWLSTGRNISGGRVVVAGRCDECAGSGRKYVYRDDSPEIVGLVSEDEYPMYIKYVTKSEWHEDRQVYEIRIRQDDLSKCLLASALSGKPETKE